MLLGTVQKTVPYELAQTLPISISPAAWTIAFRFAHVCRVTHVERAPTVLMLTQAPHAQVLLALLLRYSLFRHNLTRYCIELQSASHQTRGRRSIVLQTSFFSFSHTHTHFLFLTSLNSSFTTGTSLCSKDSVLLGSDYLS